LDYRVLTHGCNHGCKGCASHSGSDEEPVVVSATISVTTPLSCGATMRQSALTVLGAGGNARTNTISITRIYKVAFVAILQER
jgi:organic radical activating enzyme